MDALLRDILSAFSRQTEIQRSEIAERLRELEELERLRLAKEDVIRIRSKNPGKEKNFVNSVE